MREGVQPRQRMECNLDERRRETYTREGVQPRRGGECNLYEKGSATHTKKGSATYTMEGVQPILGRECNLYEGRSETYTREGVKPHQSVITTTQISFAASPFNNLKSPSTPLYINSWIWGIL